MLRLRGSVRKRSVSANRILPIATAGLRTAKPIKGECQSVVRDGPDCIPWRRGRSKRRIAGKS
jgi:hypothetical protein